VPRHRGRTVVEQTAPAPHHAPATRLGGAPSGRAGPRPAAETPRHDWADAQSEGDPMDALTDHETEVILQRLETVAAELEHAPSAYTFYLWVLLAETFAGTRPAVATLAAIRRCVTLAHRMRAIRAVLLPDASPWNPLTALGDLLHAEATRLTTLYGVARPACRTRGRELRQALHAAFTQATGKVYQTYGPVKTAKERTTITAFWDEALRTAVAQFQATGTAETLDAVLACLPAWTDRHHARWSTRGWREPAPPEVMQRLTAYLQVCEACLGTIAEVAAAAMADAPVVERAQVAPAVEQAYAAQINPLRAQLSALPPPREVPKAQQAQLRKDRAQLQHALDELLRTQEAAITRQVKQSANARHKLATLGKTVQGYPATLLRKVGKASVDVLPRIIWIYDFERQGDDDWRTAKRDARRFLRQVRHARAQPVAGEAP